MIVLNLANHMISIDCCTGQNEVCEDSYLGEGSDVYHFLKDCENGCYCYFDPLNVLPNIGLYFVYQGLASWEGRTLLL